MSRANVEIARRGFQEAAAGDFSVIAELLDPEVKWHGGDRTGGCQDRVQALRFMREAAARGGVGRLVDVIDAGDQVVLIIEPPVPDGTTPVRRANVSTFRDGRVVEMVAYESPEQACAAAGVASAP